MKIFIIILLSVSTFTYGQSGKIETIELIHCTHTDYGYTDNPIIAMDLQTKFIDIAIDFCVETQDSSDNKKFYWTAEALDPVLHWWNKTSNERKKLLVKFIQNGQIDVNYFPFHMQSGANSRQWDLFMHWATEEQRQKFNSSFGMMNDVNGIPRAAAIQLLNNNIHHLWMGVNKTFGGAPFKQPSAFWWQMPDGRKLLVWNGLSYWEGNLFFMKPAWRIVQQQANNPMFNTPRQGDMLACDEASVRAAHQICLKKIEQLQKDGYNFDFIPVTFTNEWRTDNDGPFEGLLPFVKKWNELGLKPAIHLTTASKAMKLIEQKLGDKINTYHGEWTDYWVFGSASVPRELAAARQAGQINARLLSPVFGKNDDATKRKVEEIDRLLCRYWEHTYAANESNTDPYGNFNQGHLTEKALFAYRPYELAKWTLAQKIRSVITSQPEGLYLINTNKNPFTGWISIDKRAIRNREISSLLEVYSNKMIPLISYPWGYKAWIDSLPSQKITRFVLSNDSIPIITVDNKFSIDTDSTGWPISVKWPHMKQSLFIDGSFDLISMQTDTTRYGMSQLWNEPNDTRKKKVDEIGEYIQTKPLGKVHFEETNYTIKYKQKLAHPRLENCERVLEIDKKRAFVTFDMTFDRTSFVKNSEIFYIRFVLPDNLEFPTTSISGIPMQPYREQLPGTCTDFYNIDGWLQYPSSTGNIIWYSRDASLVTFGAPGFAVKRDNPPANMNQLYAMVYNNIWFTNFEINSTGKMQFHFILGFQKEIQTNEVQSLVESWDLQPLMMYNPINREHKIVTKHINKISTE